MKIRSITASAALLAVAHLSTGSIARGQAAIMAYDEVTHTLGEYVYNAGSYSLAYSEQTVTSTWNPNNMVQSGSSIYLVTSTGVAQVGIATGAVNSSFISGLSGAQAITAAGSDLYVLYQSGSTYSVAQYSTGGSLVNPNFISGLSGTETIASNGSTLVVANRSGLGSPYTTDGQLVGEPFSPGTTSGLTESANRVFIAAYNGGSASVAEEDATGNVFTYSLISGLANSGAGGGNDSTSLSISGNDLYVATGDGVAEYTTSGTLVNGAAIDSLGFVPGLRSLDLGFTSIVAVSAVPEPRTWGLIVSSVLFAAVLAARWYRSGKMRVHA